MTTEPRILVVEDDKDLGNVLAHYLQMNGFAVSLHQSGKEGLQAFQKGSYALCVLDIMLPEMDGFQLAEAIRQHAPEVPFLFLTARHLKEDRLKGLRLGADDYLTKPFEPEELLLRMKNILKRAGHPIATTYSIGRYVFDYSRYLLSCGDYQQQLTSREADLLHLLVQHANTVLKRTDILEAVWGQDDFFLGRSMDVFISRLRKYLALDSQVTIKSIRGVGIMLEITSG